MSDRLKSSFTTAELADLRHQLHGLRSARADLDDNANEMTREIAQKAKVAAKIAFRALIKKVPSNATTLAVATLRSFQSTRRSHAMMLEEAGRASEADTIGLFSHYRGVDFRMLVGNHKQLYPALFGPAIQNNFHAQGRVALLSRLRATGFYTPELKTTPRYRNPDLLEVSRIANKDEQIEATPGSFDDQATKDARNIMNKIWKKPCTILFIFVHGFTVLKSPIGLVYNAATAIATMRGLVSPSLGPGVIPCCLLYSTVLYVQLCPFGRHDTAKRRVPVKFKVLRGQAYS